MPNSVGQMNSLCHPIDFSGLAPERDLALLWKAGGRQCFYLTFGKACDLAVVWLTPFPSDMHFKLFLINSNWSKYLGVQITKI